MTTQERWDVVVKVLSGPLSGLGEQVFRGPVVRIGANPGPGGFQLTGYRGLDARQAVITAYDGGSAAIAPVGANQVRIAPHAHVNWKEIDPVPGPVYLSKGCAIHLGPVGRGATLEFVECRRLGVWTKGNLASEFDAVASVGFRQQGGPTPSGLPPPPNAPPPAYDARKVGNIRASLVPIWFIGGLFMMFTVSVALMVVAAAVYFRPIESLGPRIDGEYWKDYATVDKAQLEELGLLEGLQQPFNAFVMQPNVEASKRRALADPANWDEGFYDRVAASVVQHVQWKNFFRRLEEIKDDYAFVTREMQNAGLPEVFAGIPYRESQYRAEMQSVVCAKGYWQFMPEVAYRVQQKGGLDFVVKDCRFSDAPDALWSPTELAPPPNVYKNAKYVTADGKCRIPKENGCRIDDRTDLEKSTAAAIYSLKEAWEDEELRQSGALVQLTIASHNAGYADGRFGRFKSGNMKPAFAAWAKNTPEAEHPFFYGRNILCQGEQGDPLERCGGVLARETQNYVYPIVARHILAVCYYAKNHSEIPAFSRWTVYLSEGKGYCSQFNIPDRSQL